MNTRNQPICFTIRPYIMLIGHILVCIAILLYPEKMFIKILDDRHGSINIEAEIDV